MKCLNNNIKKIIYSILAIALMLLIFYFSNQPADESTAISDGFIERTIGNVYMLFDNNATEENLNEIKSIYAFPIRKLAHVFIYFILGILILLLIREFNLSFKNIIIISFLICIIYSISDEIHQLFIPGRSGEIRDVILDGCGSLIGILLSNKLLKNK